MARDTFTLDIRRFIDENLSSEAMAHVFATDVMAIRDDLVARGEAARNWTTTVNGVPGASEYTIRPGGSIVYNFSVLAEATSYAFGYCVGRSPVKSGDYRDSWTILVDDAEWSRPIEEIQAGSVVTIVNTAPYARKIDVGSMSMSVPPGIVEAARQATRRRFSNMSIERQFIKLGGGPSASAKWPVPYILKGAAPKRLAKLDPRSSAFRRGQRYLARRKDLAAGQPIAYPALILKEV